MALKPTVAKQPQALSLCAGQPKNRRLFPPTLKEATKQWIHGVSLFFSRSTLRCNCGSCPRWAFLPECAEPVLRRRTKNNLPKTPTKTLPNKNSVLEQNEKHPCGWGKGVCNTPLPLGTKKAVVQSRAYAIRPYNGVFRSRAYAIRPYNFFGRGRMQYAPTTG